MHDYYYRDSDENDGNDGNEVIIQATGNVERPLSIRLTEETPDDPMLPIGSVMINLPIEEIDRMIAGLQAAKQKIQSQQ